MAWSKFDVEWYTMTKHVGNNIRALMVKEDITAQMLAEWTDLSIYTINTLLCPTPRYHTSMHLKRIADCLRVTVEWLQAKHDD